MEIDVDSGNVLWYSIENETPTQIAAINLGGCFVLGAKMSEEITQHIITEGGEFMSRRIGIMDDFEPNGYMANITNIPPYNLIQATEDTFVSFDSVLKLWFTRTEIH